MKQSQTTIFRVLIAIAFLMAGFAPGILAAPKDDAATILADCKETLDKKLEDCCEDFGERADRGVKNIEKDLKDGKCNSARKKRDTSLNLIGNDFDQCTLKLAELGGKCDEKLGKAIEDPEALAEAKEKVNAWLKDIAIELTDCYEKERSRISDAYATGAAEAGCDDN